MNCKLNYLNFFKKIYFSEKSNFFLNKNKTLVFKVNKDVNKIEISLAIKKLFNFKIKKIRTLWVKSKKKNRKNKTPSYTKRWKKVYVILKDHSNLELSNLFK